MARYFTGLSNLLYLTVVAQEEVQQLEERRQQAEQETERKDNKIKAQEVKTYLVLNCTLGWFMV